ncbi:MAG: 50S ribosomal protein L29 [Gammaproteobacteria bacterium]|nr:50S ribosomal protein L29 [Gammaproteobacteria bacterium]
MTITELREKNVDELKQALLEARREQFDLRMKSGTGQLKTNHLFGLVRRKIARIHTLLREKEVGKA